MSNADSLLHQINIICCPGAKPESPLHPDLLAIIERYRNESTSLGAVQYRVEQAESETEAAKKEVEVEQLRDHHSADRGRRVRTPAEILEHINADHPCCIGVGDAVALTSEVERLQAERDENTRKWHLLLQDMHAHADPEGMSSDLLLRIEEALTTGCAPDCGSCEQSIQAKAEVARLEEEKEQAQHQCETVSRDYIALQATDAEIMRDSERKTREIARLRALHRKHCGLECCDELAAEQALAAGTEEK